MTNIEKYRIFCKTEKDIPLFSKDWWLDAVCDEGEWNVLIYEKGNKIWATMPYYLKNKYGFKILTVPKLTQTMGPYIKYPEKQKYYKKLSWEKEIMDYFIDNLPKFDYFSQSFKYSITNWLPFYWREFNETTGYTYVIEDVSNLDIVFNNFNSSAKKNINKAIKNDINIIDSEDIDTLYNINKITFEKQNIQMPYLKKFIQKIFNTLKKHNSVIIKFAIKNDDILSVMMGVVDNNSIYMLIGSSNRNIKTYGAEYLLYWEMIKYANQEKLAFDFEGSMINGVETRNRSFGAIQKPYFQITKTNSKLLKTIGHIQESLQ